MLALTNGHGAFYLEKRQNVGVWGGLWSLPEFDCEEDVYAWCAKQHIDCSNLERLPQRRHTFSHYHLDFVPLVVPTGSDHCQIGEPSLGSWLIPNETIGLPAPILKLLTEIAD
jgi:A/G-specific adenine glycosylase